MESRDPRLDARDVAARRMQRDALFSLTKQTRRTNVCNPAVRLKSMTFCSWWCLSWFSCWFVSRFFSSHLPPSFMMTVKKTSHSHCFPLSSPDGQTFLRFLSTILGLMLTGTGAQMGANQSASWDTSRGEDSSRARYLQRRVGARHGPLLCFTVTLVGLGLSLCKPNNSIVGRACGTAYLSVGPHASTIDGSSEWGWDLGVWMLAVCSAAAGIQLTRA